MKPPSDAGAQNDPTKERSTKSRKQKKAKKPKNKGAKKVS
jgi:hypothetical protein